MHDIEVEQGLLGYLLMNNAAWPALSLKVSAEAFYEPLHAEIWTVCSSLLTMGKKASPVTVRQFLPGDAKVGELTIKQYLARLAADCCMAGEALQFAEAVKDMADKRAIVEIAGELAKVRDADPTQLATWGVQALDGIMSSRVSSGAPAVTMAEAVTRAIDATATAFQHSGRPRGLSYGITALDDRTLGAFPGELIVLGGRPGMGKTALALGLARNIARDGHPVFFYSGEMVDVDLSQRMIADEMWSPGARMTYWQLASGKFHENVFQRVVDAGRALAELPIRIEQEPGLTVHQIAARARQWRHRNGLRALFVDHLGLVRASDRYAGSKVNEVGEITMSLKALAKELEVPIFLLCQINRGVESREDKRPALADLRHSGDIEQDADTVIFLYREAYYHAKREPSAGSAEFIIWTEQMEKIQNRLEAIIDKQRRGPCGTVRLFCDIACNVVRDEIMDMDERKVDLSEAKDLV